MTWRASGGVMLAWTSRVVCAVGLALLVALFAEPAASWASCSSGSAGSSSSPVSTSSPSPSSSPTDTAVPAPSATDTATPVPAASGSQDSCVTLADDQYQPLYAAAGIVVFFLSAGYVRGMRSRG